jgi:hypothetical protein
LTFQPTLQALGAACAVICATAPAAAAQAERRIDIAGGAMATALTECAREMRVELVFDARLVAGKRASRLRGRFTPDAALGRLLAGSGLGFRRASGGAFVVYALAAADPLPPEEAVPEILVVGRRTQNTDIRRTRDDIQPYRVLTRRDIERSHRDDVEQLIRSREPLNVQPISPSQMLGGGTRARRSTFAAWARFAASSSSTAGGCRASRPGSSTSASRTSTASRWRRSSASRHAREPPAEFTGRTRLAASSTSS